MASINNVRLGACSVRFNNVDLGHTKGGVTFSYAPEWTEVNVDQYGNTPAEKYLTGEVITIKVPLAESTIANMKVAMPAGTFAGVANARMTLGRDAGLKLSSVAAQLVIHPLNEGTRVNDIVLHKAAVHSTVELNHVIDGEKVFELEFVALVDETKTSGNYLGLIGDSTA